MRIRPRSAGKIVQTILAVRKLALRSGQIGSVLLLLSGIGCGTTRMSDTQRTATEQLLISSAVDQAVSQIDFHWLEGRSVYFDPQFLDGTVDRGYVISSLRQQLLASGGILKEDRAKATYIVEARSGCIGTNRHSLLIGVPQMTVPAFVPGQPSQIPEIPLAKKNDEQGAAKLAVFAYNRVTGQRVWQSGTVEATSDARDMWVAGLGPFRKGSIAHGTELAGEELSLPLRRDDKDARGRHTKDIAPVTSAATWREPPARAAGNRSVLAVLADAALGKHFDADKSAAADSAADRKSTSASKRADNKSASNVPDIAKPVFLTPTTPNAGGHAETAPATIMMSGLGNQPSGL